MHTIHRPLYLLFISCLLLAILLPSCRKDFLGQQSSTRFDVPHTPEELQALLDNEVLFSQSPAAGFISANEVYLTNSYFDTLLPRDRNLYTWQKEIYGQAEIITDWIRCYEQIACVNQVIAGLQQLDPAAVTPAILNSLQGHALFARAYAHYNLAQLYAPPYDSLEADTALGIPLQISDKVNERAPRATLQATYQQILSDLQQARGLLPTAIDKAHPNRPSQPAAYAMQARVFLSMRRYQQAAKAADSCLRLYSTLTDYNELDTLSFLPFSPLHAEILYQSKIQEENGLVLGLVNGGASIDSNLYRSYAPGDLRPALFFNRTQPGPPVKCSYYGDFNPFTGLATDEVYLIRAESEASLGQTAAALADLNALLAKRMKPEFFVARQSTDAATVLAWVRTEREKELVLRGQRWTDIRRLNKEGKGITLTRKVKGVTYELLPNSVRYTLPIPPQAVSQDSLQQNPR